MEARCATAAGRGSARCDSTYIRWDGEAVSELPGGAVGVDKGGRYGRVEGWITTRVLAMMKDLAAQPHGGMNVLRYTSPLSRKAVEA